MAGYLSLTEGQAITTLRGFLTAVLPSGVEVVKGQVNRVPEPLTPDFVVMTPITRRRIETNQSSWSDAVFTGSITGAIMTISAVTLGSVVIGAPVTGAGVAAGTIVTQFLTGTGGVGTYGVSVRQNVATTALMAGTRLDMAATELSVQCDVHGPCSSDNVQIVATLFRSEVATTLFSASGVDCQPLYCGEPRQVPFVNGEHQVEYRWSVDTVMQVNPVVVTQQQFAAALAVGLIEVDTYLTQPAADLDWMIDGAGNFLKTADGGFAWCGLDINWTVANPGLGSAIITDKFGNFVFDASNNFLEA